MAIFTRTNGDAKGVVNVDVGTRGAGIGQIIATGIGKHPTAFKIDSSIDLRGEMGVGGQVETILRVLSTRSTIIAYQVENNDSGQLSVLVEATSFDASGLQSELSTAGVTASVSTSAGMKFA
jgi:hypothetical protein